MSKNLDSYTEETAPLITLAPVDSGADEESALWVYRIPPERLGDLRAKMAKLQRKATRYGNAGPFVLTIGELQSEVVAVVDWDGATRKETRYFHPVTIEAPNVRVGEFELLAKVEHTESGAIFSCVPNASAGPDKRFREMSSDVCEHCNASRKRSAVFIVRNVATGEQKQIGRNCLADHCGINPEAALQAFQHIREARGLCVGSLHYEQLSVESALTLGAVCVRLFGWCSQGQAQADDSLISTSRYVRACLVADPQWLRPDIRRARERIIAERSEADLATAREVRNWAANLPEHTDSDYLHNLRVMASGSGVPMKRVGFLVSAISAHARAVERALRLTREREAMKASEWQGKEKERLRNLDLTQYDSRVVSGGSFGDCVLVKFRDAQGNLFSWFTGAGTGLQNGERCTVTGTVKRHAEYKGVKETQLTRCKVQRVAA